MIHQLFYDWMSGIHCFVLPNDAANKKNKATNKKNKKYIMHCLMS
jgi:hypothetical protein